MRVTKYSVWGVRTHCFFFFFRNPASLGTPALLSSAVRASPPRLVFFSFTLNISPSRPSFCPGEGPEFFVFVDRSLTLNLFPPSPSAPALGDPAARDLVERSLTENISPAGALASSVADPRFLLFVDRSLTLNLFPPSPSAPALGDPPARDLVERSLTENISPAGALASSVADPRFLLFVDRSLTLKPVPLSPLGDWRREDTECMISRQDKVVKQSMKYAENSTREVSAEPSKYHDEFLHVKTFSEKNYPVSPAGAWLGTCCHPPTAMTQ